MENEFRSCFRFIRDDIRLCAVVNRTTGKQTLVMEKLKEGSYDARYVSNTSNTSNASNASAPDHEHLVEFREYLDCIHTAIIDLTPEELNTVIADPDFGKKTLQIRSSEDVVEFNLDPIEKFKAFNSWVAGIAEAGLDALKIQSDIEGEGKLVYPIVLPLLRFLSKVDITLMFEYISFIERECMFEGVQHKSSLIANLDPILDIVIECMEGKNVKEKQDIDLILKAIFSINPPLELFTSDLKKMRLLRLPQAVEMENFSEFFDGNDVMRMNLIHNFRAVEFDEYRRFFDYRTEPVARIRITVAENPNSVEFNEFTNFLSYESEPDYRVRKAAAQNPNIASLRNKLTNFMSFKSEPSENVRKFIAKHKDFVQIEDFKNFLSFKTEPSSIVRKMAARNVNAGKLNKYSNFLSYKTEPDFEVRMIAAGNPYAKDKEEIKNLLSEKFEPSKEVRTAAIANISDLSKKQVDIITKEDFELFDYLSAELYTLRYEFDDDIREFVDRVEKLKEKLFPPEVKLEDDISRELQRLKRMTKDKRPGLPKSR